MIASSKPHDYSVVRETLYSGVWFRSRLEARWAMFFDGIGAWWRYEPEQFELDNGAMYTPDFWLPDVELHIEIKPEAPTIVEIEKASSLSKRFFPVAIICGKPDLDVPVLFFGHDACDGSGGEFEANGKLDLLPIHNGMLSFLSVHLDGMSRKDRRIVRADGTEISHYQKLSRWVYHSSSSSSTRSTRNRLLEELRAAMYNASSFRFHN